MRSYEIARFLFSILAFCAWSLVIIGALVALIGAGGGSRYIGAGAGFLAMAPGFGICLSGLLMVAFVQMGRATVDTAEYTQQMLKIARDQLEVSKQGLRPGFAPSSGLAGLKPGENQSSGSDYSSIASDSASAAGDNADIEETLVRPESYVEMGLKDGQLKHAGREIAVAKGTFHVGSHPFRTLQEARQHIDEAPVGQRPALEDTKQS